MDKAHKVYFSRHRIIQSHRHLSFFRRIIWFGEIYPFFILSPLLSINTYVPEPECGKLRRPQKMYILIVTPLGPHSWFTYSIGWIPLKPLFRPVDFYRRHIHNIPWSYSTILYSTVPPSSKNHSAGLRPLPPSRGTVHYSKSPFSHISPTQQISTLYHLLGSALPESPIWPHLISSHLIPC